MHQKVPFVDIFAGPGGLSEGFSSFSLSSDNGDVYPFKSILSAEKEEAAYTTLRLRAFLRWFVYTMKLPRPPKVYIDYVTDKSKNLSKSPSFILHDVLHADIPKVNNAQELEEALLSSLKEGWKNFASQYSDELSDILDAVLHARNDVMQFELGGEDIPSKAGDISPYIRAAVKGFNQKSEPISEFILIGGPPCQAYSNAGRSRRNKNDLKQYICDQTGQYIFDKDPRATLYKEYLRVLYANKPALFVMENVRGMLSAHFTNTDGTKEPVWKRVVSELHDPAVALGKAMYSSASEKYVITSLVAGHTCYYSGDKRQLDKLDPKKFVLRASDYGVPQNRDRVILLGIRSDLLKDASLQDVLQDIKLPTDTQKNVSVGTAINDLQPLFSSLSSISTDVRRRKSVPLAKAESEWKKAIHIQIVDVIQALNRHMSSMKVPEGEWDELLQQCLSAIRSKFEPKDLLQGDAVEPFIEGLFNCRIRAALKDVDDTIQSIVAKVDSFAELCEHYQWKNDQPESEVLKSWYKNKSEGLPVLNHFPRRHMDTDLARYVYAACYAKVYKELEQELSEGIPNWVLEKARVKNAKEFLKKEAGIYDRISIKQLQLVELDPDHQNTQSFVDRFKVQRAESPSTTVTCHLSKDGHYYIHPDPVQCRSLTVREAARLQTFPDNYFFEGMPTQQRTQVGNAVPPLLAHHISEVVCGLWQRLVVSI